jgi:hypothetical protein
LTDLVASDVRFFSRGDEDVFFRWLRSLQIIGEIRGSHRDIVIEIKDQTIEDQDLEELIAIFWRYDLNFEQLSQFANENNEAWFSDKKKIWHERVFRNSNK